MKRLFLFLIFLSFIFSSYAWNDCPFGMVNCTYPGKCGRYVDTNNNGICDHSEPAPTTENKNTTNNLNELTSTVNNEEIEYNYTIKEICEKYKINLDCFISILKNKIVEKLNKEYDEKSYVDIPGKELKKYTIKEICEKYKIKAEELKKYLNLPETLSDDTTFETIKDEYGIPMSEVKKAIQYLTNENKINNIVINENTTLGEIIEKYGLSKLEIDEAIKECMNNINYNTTKEVSTKNYKIIKNNNNNGIVGDVLNILFSIINIRNLLFGWLSG
ncbi:hypothetical protein [Methanocaldococcus sp.]